MNRRTTLYLLLLATVNFAHIIDFMIIMPLGNMLFEDLDIGTQKFSYLVSIYTGSAAVSGFSGSFFIDRFGRKKLLVVAFTGFILGTFGCGIADSFQSLFLGRLVSGSFGGLLGALVLSAASDLVPPEKRGSAMGIVMTAFAVASVVGVPLGLYLAEIWNWQAPFLILGGFGVLVLILLIIILPPISDHINDLEQNGFNKIKQVVSRSNARKSFLLMFLLVFGQFCIIPFITPYLIQNADMAESHIKFIYMFGGGATIFTSPMIGKLADRYGKYLIFTISAALMLIPVIALTNIGSASYFILYTVTTALFIFSNGRFVSAMAVMSSSIDKKLRGTFMSLNSSVQQLSSAGATLVAGNIVIATNEGLKNYEIAGYITVFFTILCILFIRKVKMVE
jgi:predicted MFS family arabinose efflux permease